MILGINSAVSLNSINLLIFVRDRCCVSLATGNKSLNILENLRFQGVEVDKISLIIFLLVLQLVLVMLLQLNIFRHWYAPWMEDRPTDQHNAEKRGQTVHPRLEWDLSPKTLCSRG
jgi:hypothetical protein